MHGLMSGGGESTVKKLYESAKGSITGTAQISNYNNHKGFILYSKSSYSSANFTSMTAWNKSISDIKISLPLLVLTISPTGLITFNSVSSYNAGFAIWGMGDVSEIKAFTG